MQRVMRMVRMMTDRAASTGTGTGTSTSRASHLTSPMTCWSLACRLIERNIGAKSMGLDEQSNGAPGIARQSAIELLILVAPDSVHS